MSKDYYDILGVEKNVTKEEIKKAYKNLAKKYHPDLNKEEGSSEKFKEINEAAAILADDEKRSHYDQFGTSEGMGQGHQGFDFSDIRGGGFDFGDIFDQFFGGGGFGRSQSRQRRGSDLRYDMEITLEEAAKGITKHIQIPRTASCNECNGSGAESESDIGTCPDCNGAGMQRKTQRTPFGMFSTTVTCSKCRGEGKHIKKECKGCDGTGLVKETRKLEINIPAGAEEGTNLRLQGEGEAGPRGSGSGDLYVVLHVLEHDVFERHGDDLYVKIKIPFTVAALGGEVEVPTLEGNAKLKIPSGTQNNTVFRMKGKGIPYLHGSGTGNENVAVIVEVPKKLSKKQKKILEDFQKESKEKKGILGKLF